MVILDADSILIMETNHVWRTHTLCFTNRVLLSYENTYSRLLNSGIVVPNKRLGGNFFQICEGKIRKYSWDSFVEKKSIPSRDLFSFLISDLNIYSEG